MIESEEFARARLEACLTAAEASTLPKVREKHLSAARTWQFLLAMTMERAANSDALLSSASQKAAEGDTHMGEPDFEIPDKVSDALDEGTPAVKAFRQSSGLSQHDIAANAGIVALTQVLDADTGEVIEEPTILARHGGLPKKFQAED